jgi:protein SCO1/2
VSRSTRLVVALAAALVGVAIGWLIQSFDVTAPARVGGPFTLTDQDGRRVTDQSYRGKVMAVFFGFTNCPDICPTGLARMTEILDALGPDAARVQPIFITVDPRRDTPEALRAYVRHFSDAIVALSGSEAEIAAAARDYRVYFKIHGDPAAGRDYVVDHSTFVYVMDGKGGFVGTFTPDTPVDAAVKLIRRAL